MKYLFLVLTLIGLMVPLACMYNTPTSNYNSGSNSGGRNTTPTSTPTNLNGWTSTPTATLQATPAFISSFSASSPNGIAYGNSLIYVAEGDGASVSQVQVLNASTNAVVSTWTGSGSTPFQYPNGVAVNSTGTTVYVLDINNSSGEGIVYALAPSATPTPITAWTKYNGTTLSEPNGIALDSTDNVYIADSGNALLEEFGPTGNTIGSWSSRNVDPVAVAMDPSNNVYVADENHKLWVLSNSSGTFTVTASWELPNAPRQNTFYGLASDANNVYVADYYNDQVEVYTHAGALIGLFNGNQPGSTPLDGPDALLLYTTATTSFYVGNIDNNLVEIFGPNNY
jgi:tripartite motif-containing protein 71